MELMTCLCMSPDTGEKMYVDSLIMINQSAWGMKGKAEVIRTLPIHQDCRSLGHYQSP